MGRTGLVTALAICAGLAACGGGGDDDDSVELIGPDADFGEAVEIADRQLRDVEALAFEEGYTPWTSLPASGSASYQGVISGTANGGNTPAAPPLDYVADLALDVDFASDAVTGSIDNFVTSGMRGFANPDGRVRLSGSIMPDMFDEGMMLMGGTGTLEGSTVTADVLVEAEGFFVGGTGQGLIGDHISEFAWRNGPGAGTTSWSDGTLSAEQLD